jgi:hypothetical protein
LSDGADFNTNRTPKKPQCGKSFTASLGVAEDRL